MANAGSQTQTLKLTTPVEMLPGVTPARAAELRRLDIPSLAHLVAHLPHRHETYEPETTIDKLIPGHIVSTRGAVIATRPMTQGQRPRFVAVLADPTGSMEAQWFNQLYLRSKIVPGQTLRVQGKAKRTRSGVTMSNPAWTIVGDDDAPPPGGITRLRPIYSATEELPSFVIERLIDGVLDAALPQIEDHLTPEFRRERELPPLADAYRMMHRPASSQEIATARRRLVYDEFLLLQLGVHLKRAHLVRTLHAPALRWDATIDRHIRARLPFALTEGQDSAVAEVAIDLQRSTPANRLIQGDVGAGKTVVALYAMLMAVASKHQAALMAPTELLAEQHHQVITAMLAGSKVRVALLTGATPPNDRQVMLARLESGEIDLLIGTHALITDSVRFRSLAVAIIDEQHRFGVHQRARLREKASDERSMPHTLVMTATPIPRTLSLTVFGDLDVSIIRGMPPGRKPVKTRWVRSDQAEEVYAFVRQKAEAGEQAFVVVPAVEGADTASGTGSLKDVRSTAARLAAGPLKGLRVAGVHGRLSSKMRSQIMARFRSHLIDVLVATTVIEVGVDIPDATVIVIEHAERFGLAQLHQLRGRVGRGKKRGACILIGDPPTPDAEARLRVLASTTDGFVLAEKDMEIRGPGELFGLRQSGASPLRLASLPADMDLLLMARRDAGAWLEASPSLNRPEDRLARTRLFKAYGESLGLVDVA